MQFQTVKHRPADRSYMYAASDENLEELCGHYKQFMLRRDKYADALGAVNMIADGCEDPDNAHCRTLSGVMAALALPVTQKGGLYKVLELGCASGNLIYALKTMMQDGGVRVTGLEIYRPWIEKFRRRHPGHRVIEAGVDGFLSMDGKDFPEAPFDAFYCGLTLCTVPPRAARAVLAKAASLCRRLVIYDCLINGFSELDSDSVFIFSRKEGTEAPVIAHNFRKYLEDAGLEAESAVLTPLTGAGRGDHWGALRTAPAAV